MSMQMATRRSKAMAGLRAELYRMVSVAVQTVPDAFLFPLQRPVWVYVNSMDLELLRLWIAPFFTEEASAQGTFEKIQPPASSPLTPA
jgi:hypothetical protein